MTVTAEGVETVAQMDMLEQLGCDQVQGYLISKPAPVEAVAAMVTKWRPALALSA